MDTMFILVPLLLLIGGAGGALFGSLVCLLLFRPQPNYSSVAALEAFDRRVFGWTEAGQISLELASHVRALLAADRAGLLGWAPPAPPSPVAPLPSSPVAHAPQPAVQLTSAPAGVITAQAVPMVAAASALPAAAPASVAPHAPQAAPQTPPTPRRRQLLYALLALATRRTLLFLGSFLLAISSVTLVVFNWASFAPIVQVGLLATVSGSLWACGSWMLRRPDLAAAGQNLQAVAGLLVPVVGFALTRPGLLDLAPRASWLAVSLLSLLLYFLASWRTQRGFYSVAAALAASSALLASLGNVEVAWLATPMAWLFCIYLPIAWRLRSGPAPALAAGPFWVAHIGLPLALAAQVWIGSTLNSAALAALLAVATLFYSLAAWLDHRPTWVLMAALLLPSAIVVALDATGLDGRAWSPALALLGLGYLGLGVAWERGQFAIARPLFGVAPLLASCGLLAAIGDAVVARTTLPIILLGVLSITALVEQGRLAWIGNRRVGLASAALAAATLLLPAWLVALLDLTPWSAGVRGLWLLPLAGAYFAAANWWPGRLRRAYDLVLQAAGTFVVFGATGATLLDERTWVPGAALAATIWAGQAILRRRSAWAALALGSAMMAGGLALLRTPTQSAEAWIWLGVGYAVLYAVGGSLGRRTAWSYWIWPTIGWASLSGWFSLMFLGVYLLTNGPVRPAHTAALLALSALSALMVWLWRRAWLGYLATALLGAGVLLAADHGFHTAWQPAPGDLAYVVCALAAGLGLFGHWLRRLAPPAYARPTEQLGLALLTVAPLLAGPDRAHLSLTWAAMAGLYAIASWRHRLPLLVGAAWLAIDMALLHGSAWLLPAGPIARGSLLLLGAAATQTCFALLARRSAAASPRAAGRASYAVALLSGFGALLFAAGSAPHAAAVGLGLAALLALVAMVERHEQAAWGALAMLAIGLGSLHQAIGLALLPSLGWGMAEALALYLLGWAVASRQVAALDVWRGPLRRAPLAVGLLIGLGLAASATLDTNYAYLSFGLAGIGLLLALASRREQQPLGLGAALVVWDLAALSLALWRFPLATADQLAPVMLVAAWLQGLAAIDARRRSLPRGRPLYGAALASAALALALAQSDNTALTAACFALALLAGLAAWAERHEGAAWGSVGLAVFGAWFLHAVLQVAPGWSEAWLVLELLGVALAGWGLERLGNATWRRPTTIGPLALGSLLTLLVAQRTLAGFELPALTFALASLGLLLATLSVRGRTLGYAYAAGAALVAAGLCQLANWGVRELQGYVLPAGIYLLALAEGLRRFQGKGRVSQVIEAGALLMLLGASLGQALRDESGLLYELLLCGEALLVVAYGSLLRLRVPFMGGVSFFVVGVLLMVIENVQITNQWVLFGSVGLLMIAAYVLLERYQERLLRAGRVWMTELRSWQ